MEVKLFGILAEKAGKEHVEVEATNTDELRLALRQYIPNIESFAFGIAVNRRLVETNTSLNGNEEVAVLPPFAGG